MESIELLVLDTDFTAIAAFDTFESIIWTDRYSEYGDFEIYTRASTEIIDLMKIDRYLYFRGSEHLMIIENVQLDTDVEDGTHLTISGRSLESILDRRIIWAQTILSGNLQNGIKKLLDENVISPSDSSRKIPNFKFIASTDTAITDLKIDAQYTGDNLYESISSICDSLGIGFKIVLTDSGEFNFSLYSGKDRSYDQTVNPYIVFSPGFDNILNSSYVESKKTLKTVTLVAGEGEGSERKTVETPCESGAGSGLDRREMYTDARDISMISQEGITEEEYKEQLKQRGLEYLSQNTYTQTFEGEVDSSRSHIFGEDYLIGDIVQVVNEYGLESKSRVNEYVISQSESGIEAYPTFVNV